jgi:hypothetical protein
MADEQNVRVHPVEVSVQAINSSQRCITRSAAARQRVKLTSFTNELGFTRIKRLLVESAADFNIELLDCESFCDLEKSILR